MSDLDTLLAAGQALAAVHTAVGQAITAALYYGPGVLVTAAAVAAWRTGQWTVRRHDQWLHDRADRRAYTARAFRLCRVADSADAVMAIPADDLNRYLDNKLAATPDLAPEEGR
ncbi:hypothetical protein ACIQJW_08080 [Streptomyces californicus]|nr:MULTISPECIES: hypothetical protein [Streptomyces]KOG78745.1 hypothetical protein ADK33_25885 [Streptomyces griseus subsp. rhodochrous]KUJ69716.1 hypothetical protein ACZ90_09290 [Streptomyces albus subsp. albus]